MLRMVTLNIDGATDVPMLIQFLREVKPDVVAFQEGPPAALLLDEMKGDFFMARGYDTFVASRHPIVKQTLAPEASNHPYYSPATRFDIAIPAGIVHVNCLHLYSLRKGLESVANVWWDGASELERVTAIRNEESQISARFAKESGGPTVVLGDFNMTSDSTVFDRDWHDWQNAFAIRGFGLGYTFATSRIGLRIDHVLADQRHWHIRSCRVGPDLHGQHRPVIAELILLENAIARRELQPPSMSSQASPSRKKSPP
jgi:endonuclease/exonuclease/phosphatase family metal-dependent hydrolase